MEPDTREDTGRWEGDDGTWYGGERDAGANIREKKGGQSWRLVGAYGGGFVVGRVRVSFDSL